jgi:hypothetical protein
MKKFLLVLFVICSVVSFAQSKLVEELSPDLVHQVTRGEVKDYVNAWHALSAKEKAEAIQDIKYISIAASNVRAMLLNDDITDFRSEFGYDKENRHFVLCYTGYDPAGKWIGISLQKVSICPPNCPDLEETAKK